MAKKNKNTLASTKKTYTIRRICFRGWPVGVVTPTPTPGEVSAALTKAIRDELQVAAKLDGLIGKSWTDSPAGARASADGDVISVLRKAWGSGAHTGYALTVTTRYLMVNGVDIPVGGQLQELPLNGTQVRDVVMLVSVSNVPNLVPTYAFLDVELQS